MGGLFGRLSTHHCVTSQAKNAEPTNWFRRLSLPTHRSQIDDVASRVWVVCWLDWTLTCTVRNPLDCSGCAGLQALCPHSRNCCWRSEKLDQSLCWFRVHGFGAYAGREVD